MNASSPVVLRVRRLGPESKAYMEGMYFDRACGHNVK